MSSVSATTSFKDWTEKNPNWKDALGVYQRDSSTYQRLCCRLTIGSTAHEYHGVINVNNGDLYTDDRKRKIAAKHLTLIIVRPLHACVKTLWHASIVGPLAFEIFACLKKGQSVKTLALHMKQSMADIIRTPLYSTAMVIVHLAAVVLGAFAPNTFYHTRSAASFLERRLLREEKVWRNKWKLAPCLSPQSRICPENGMEEVRQSLDRLIVKLIKVRRERRVFNDCFHRLPKGVTYVSAAAKKQRSPFLSESPLQV